MSDRLLRDLERRAADGDPTVRAQLLRERVRVGAVREDRLRLLARLGDGLAREVLGGTWPAPVEDATELMAALRPNAERGLVVRSVIAVAALGVDVWETTLEGDPLARHAVSTAAAWWSSIEDGRDDPDLAARARAASAAASQAALAAPRPAASAGRAASEPAVTIEATGGRFLTSADTVTALVRSAGVPDAWIREAVLATIRREVEAPPAAQG